MPQATAANPSGPLATHASRTPPKNLQLPETDDGLPGTGPIRRFPWFRELWLERRQAFADQRAFKQGSVVFLGDSITQFWGDDLGGSFGRLRVANLGISGDTTRGVLIRLHDVVALRPTAVVLLIGTNDIEEHAEPSSTLQNVQEISARLHQDLPKVPLILCELFPSSAQVNRPQASILALNAGYAKLAQADSTLHLVATWKVFANADGDAKPVEFPDLLHPNEVGYKKWADALRPVLTELHIQGP